MERSKFPREIRELMDRLDQAVPPHSDMLGEAGNEPLVETAQRLSQAPQPALSKVALNRIEAKLRAQAVQLRTPVRPAQPRVGRRMGWVWRYGLAACLVLVLLVTTVTHASASSLPGEHLYPVKRAIEKGRLAFVSEDGEPELRVDFASRRVGEFESLLKRDKVYPSVLEEASDQFDRVLNLLEAGHGNPEKLGQRIIDLVQRETALIELAAPPASSEEWQRLEAINQRSESIRQRAEYLSRHDITPDLGAVPLPAVESLNFASTPVAVHPAATLELSLRRQLLCA